MSNLSPKEKAMKHYDELIMNYVHCNNKTEIQTNIVEKCVNVALEEQAKKIFEQIDKDIFEEHISHSFAMSCYCKSDYEDLKQKYGIFVRGKE